MGTLQPDVNGFNNRSLQFDGNFRGVYSKKPAIAEMLIADTSE